MLLLPNPTLKNILQILRTHRTLPIRLILGHLHTRLHLSPNTTPLKASRLNMTTTLPHRLVNLRVHLLLLRILGRKALHRLLLCILLARRSSRIPGLISLLSDIPNQILILRCHLIR
jgi:hypothetical protein